MAVSGLCRREQAHLPRCSRSGVGAFRADPQVQEALDASVADLWTPTPAEGETYEDLLADRSAVEAAGQRGYGYVRLEQLAVDLVMSVR